MEIIQEQRRAFPNTKLHGFSHIARCIILTKSLSEAHKLPMEDELRCYIAIAFHDVAREDDGEDVWEHESGGMAMEFCEQKGLSKEFQKSVYDLITKKTYVSNLPTPMLVVCHDADCLDIIRVFGLEGFVKKHFASFCGDNPLRADYILDASVLIDLTEDSEFDFDNKDSLITMENFMRGDWRNKFTQINTFKQL